MLTITGGKLTTWRRMAKQVVDRLGEREGREVPCRTADIPLGMEASPEALTPPPPLEPGQLPEDAAEQLAFRYGHAARNVLAVAAERPELARPIVPGHPDMLAEAVLAARLEQARSVGDVLLRRTRLALVAAPDLRTAESVMPVAEAIGARARLGRRPRPRRGRRVGRRARPRGLRPRRRTGLTFPRRRGGGGSVAPISILPPDGQLTEQQAPR